MLVIRTSMVFILVFAGNTILLCFLVFFVIINFLMPAIIAQVFNATAELAIPTGTPTNEANPEIETQPLTAEKKTRKCTK